MYKLDLDELLLEVCLEVVIITDRDPNCHKNTPWTVNLPPAVIQLLTSDNTEIMAYFEKVRKYDQLAKWWNESRGLPCQPTALRLSEG